MVLHDHCNPNGVSEGTPSGPVCRSFHPALQGPNRLHATPRSSAWSHWALHRLGANDDVPELRQRLLRLLRVVQAHPHPRPTSPGGEELHQRRSRSYRDVRTSFFYEHHSRSYRWLVAFPTDVIKNRMQAQPLDSWADRPYKTTRETIRKMYAKEGLKGFWRGFTPCLLRSKSSRCRHFPILEDSGFPANGAAFMAMELVMRYMP